MKNRIKVFLDIYVQVFSSIIVWCIKTLDTPFTNSSRPIQIRFKVLEKIGSFRFRGQLWSGTTSQLKYMTKDRLLIESDLVNKISSYSTITTGVFWDVGACVGNFSIAGASSFKEIFAFEPDGFTFSSLVKNINNSGKVIKPLNFAFTDRNLHLAAMYYSNTIEANAHHSVESPQNYVGDTFSPVLQLPVLGLRADEFINLFHLTVPEFVKIDVDGMELEILESFGDYLSHPSLRVVVAEVSPQNPKMNRLLNLMNSNGFCMEPKSNVSTDNLCFYKADRG
jgi:FkbM family methyltransferase